MNKTFVDFFSRTLGECFLKHMRCMLAIVALNAMFLAAFSAAAVCAYAQEVSLDPEAVGSITLDLSGSSADGSDGLVGGTIALYRVAGVSLEDGAHYDVDAGQFVNSKTAARIPKLNSDELDAQNVDLAQELLDEAKAEGIGPIATAGIESKRAAFPTLRLGLYLLSQAEPSEDGRGIRTFLLSVPDAAGELDVVARPKPGLTPPAPSAEEDTLPLTPPSEMEKRRASPPDAGTTSIPPKASTVSRVSSSVTPSSASANARTTPSTSDSSASWLLVFLLSAAALAAGQRGRLSGAADTDRTRP